MRFQVPEKLGAPDVIDLLKALRDAPNEVFDTQIIQYIEYLWQNYSYQIYILNALYVVYPMCLITSFALAREDMHENWVAGLAITSVPTLIELF